MTQDQGLAGLLGRENATLAEMTIADLLPFVESAAGPDRELDRAIWYKLVFDPELEKGGDDWLKTPGIGHSAPAFTASLDAALALCTRVLPGWGWIVNSLNDACIRNPEDHDDEFGGSAKSPALAILAALLRALISQSSESGEGDRASRSQNGCAPKSATSDAEPSGAGEP